MLKLTRITSSSLALILALFAGSAHGQDVKSDPTFDVKSSNSEMIEELEKTEDELREFFKEDTDTNIALYDYEPAPDLNAREESALLDRAEQEAQEFNDIDDDDLSELGREDTVRLEKPGQVEKDVPLVCPLGTEMNADGSCGSPE